MPSKKLHTAFVSCPTELREERRAVLDVLLSFDAFPISTEFFTIQSKDGFRDIEQLIDDSDYFILLLSDRSGSVLDLPDGTCASWTELEARYAFAHAEENGQKIIVFQLPQLTAALSADPATLDAQTRRQVAFANSLAGNTVNAVGSVTELRTRLATFIEGAKSTGATPGWIRGFSREGLPGLAFGKTYHHVHLSQSLPDYLRIGTIRFSCSTTAPRMVHADAVNYKAALGEDGRVVPRLGRNKTEWTAEYAYDAGRLHRHLRSAQAHSRNVWRLLDFRRSPARHPRFSRIIAPGPLRTGRFVRRRYQPRQPEAKLQVRRGVRFRNRRRAQPVPCVRMPRFARNPQGGLNEHGFRTRHRRVSQPDPASSSTRRWRRR